jgi:biotin synthase
MQVAQTPTRASSRQDVRALYAMPLMALIDRARSVHLAHHPASEVELCTLLSVKTGGCSEDCGYCAQSSHHATGVRPQRMLDVEQVLAKARIAKEFGSTRFCMGAAWRDAKDGPAFEHVLDMIRGVKALGLEACVTLGMLSPGQAQRLKDAGLDAYNHNLDTSREHYRSIVSTHSYDDRLATLAAVRAAGITVCSGGVIGMGESIEDRCELLRTLASLDPHPESVPINALVPVPGTPLEGAPRVDPLDVVRMVACARILMPSARVRLSAGRKDLPREAQILAIYAGANSIFFGDTLLTAPNSDSDDDRELLRATGLTPRRPGHGVRARSA